MGSINFVSSQFLVLSKLAGIDVVRGPFPNSFLTLAELVHSFLGGGNTTGGTFPPTPSHATVHRLDTSTSGVMVFPRTSEASSELSALFRTGAMGKTYEAVVDTRGLSPQSPLSAQSSGEISLRLGKLPGVPLLHHLNPDGCDSLTHWKVLERGQGCARLLLEPKSGRTHQLRLHCAFGLYAPIIGDALYGTLSSDPFPLMLKSRGEVPSGVLERYSASEARVQNYPRPTLDSSALLQKGMTGPVQRLLLHATSLTMPLKRGSALAAAFSSSQTRGHTSTALTPGLGEDTQTLLDLSHSFVWGKVNETAPKGAPFSVQLNGSLDSVTFHCPAPF